MAAVVTRHNLFLRQCFAASTQPKFGSSRKSSFASFNGSGLEKANFGETQHSPEDTDCSQNPSQECIHFHGKWPDHCKMKVFKDMLVYEKFITESEEASIMAEIGNYLKRMRYEFDHWDDAIHGFRETERLKWNDDNDRILSRVRRLAFPAGTPPLRHVHVLDLAADGVIKPHVDSVRFCGNVIAGLSLLSDAVMRLVPTAAEPGRLLDVLLSRRSLYIMRNSARYDYTHEILAQSKSSFDGRAVTRDRRVSIICRNEPAGES